MESPIAKPLLLAIAVASPLLIGACSTSEPSSMDAGTRISMRGEQIAERGKAWSDGKQDVRLGQSLIEKGSDREAAGRKKLARARDLAAKAQEQIDAARADSTRGEQLVADGKVQMQQAEAEYATIRNGPPAVAPASR